MPEVFERPNMCPVCLFQVPGSTYKVHLQAQQLKRMREQMKARLGTELGESYWRAVVQ